MLPPRRIGSHRPARDRWLIPYADLVTLLFAFFTALYAVTAVDASRLETMAEGLRAAVGAQAQPAPAQPIPAPPVPDVDRGDLR